MEENKPSESGSENKEDRSEENKPGESINNELANLVKALQGGYTQNSQRLSAIESALEKISSMPNNQKIETDGEEYLTVGKAKELFKDALSSYHSAKDKAEQDKLSYINRAFDELYLTGVLKDKSEEDEFISLGTKLGIGDPKILAPIWQEIKSVKSTEEKNKVIEDKKKKEEEAAKIAKEGKGGGEEKAPDVASIRKTSWGNISKLFRND
jgi:hypothetical protein